MSTDATSTSSSDNAIAAADYLPARMLNEFVYCPRLFYYEWVEGVFAHNQDTVEGAVRHERVDVEAEALPSPEELASDDETDHRARSVQLASDRYGLIAKMDLVEVSGGRVVPVDYKKGRPRDEEHGPEAWPADRAQMGVQALVLRENGYVCDEAVLYYAATKQRVRLRVDDVLIDEVVRLARAARETAEGSIPDPLADSPKCPRCSLVGICLPDETRDASRATVPGDDDLQPWLLPPSTDAAAEPPHAAIRRLVPARDDLRPLYVVGQGLSIGKTGTVLQVKDRTRKVVQEARLIDVSQVNVFGNVTISAPAIQELCRAEKPIAHFSAGGWFYALTHAIGPHNAYLRAEQFHKADSPTFCRRVASRIVAAKIRNQRTLLQRNHIEPPKLVLDGLRRLAVRAEETVAIDELLGIEGTAARLYFEQFSGMIKADETEGVDDFRFAFEQRNRRPPRDPINALLSLAYSLLARDLTVVCASIGFDPYWGFYHQPRYGRPALALDLMEMFRPLIADSAVLTAINTRMVTTADFVRAGTAVSLTPDGRKGLLRAYEQRIDGLVTHPRFDYRVSYRRVLEIQARLLARYVCGEIDEYPTFETR
jgi:CRISPR-associated protein Cas1